jgi:uncharacterized protein YdeI (YjbR/CyaY-like superfamily)
MGTKDPRVDAYIADAPDFARPILAHLRRVVHRACPDVEEAMKWSFPNFLYKGMFCNMAAFKHHCAFGFWNHARVRQAVAPRVRAGMGQFGKLTSVRDLPPVNTLAGYIKTAAALNDAGVKRTPRPKAKPTRTVVPADFKAALRVNARAAATFDAFSPSNRREYIEWITEAKQPDTRRRRLATAIEWMSAGKSRNWKYQTC